jgi:hypothetical protein
MPRERMQRERGEKIWYTIQMPAELRDAISDKALRDRVNASEFFRQCGHIFVSSASVKEALKDIEKMAARMKQTGTVSRKRKHNPNRESKVVMPNPDNLP